MTITEEFQDKLKEAGSRKVTHQGFPMRLRLIPVEIWMQNGRLPQHMANMYLRGQCGDLNGIERASQAIVQMSDEDALAFVRFKQSAIEYAAIEPKIVFEERDLVDGEISAAEIAGIAPGILDFIFAYATGRAAQSPVQTTGGEVSAGELQSFREDAGGPEEPAGFVVHGADFRADALTEAGNN